MFVRDPRDALYSSFKGFSKHKSYDDYLSNIFHRPEMIFINPPEYQNLFIETWLLQPNTKFFRFEDYKDDAEKTLRSILDFCEIEATDQQIQNAVEKSTSQRAKEAEARYIANGGVRFFDKSHNRASQKNETTHLKEIEQEAALITRRCGYIMKQLGYIDHDNFDPPPSYLPNSKLLSFYKELNVPDSFWERQADGLEDKRAEMIAEKIKQGGKYIQPEFWQHDIAKVFGNAQDFIACQPNIFWKIYWRIKFLFKGYEKAKKTRRYTAFVQNYPHTYWNQIAKQ